MERRSFLKVAGGVTGGLALGVQPALSADKSSKREVEKVTGLPRRILGRTGEKVSVVGFPGLALRHYEQGRCNEGIIDAFGKGINYYDVAPAYGRDGECEIKMGEGLQYLDRDKIFLACKTKMRDKDGALKELDRSLKRLKTDRFDLYQLHHLRSPEEVKKALGPGGAMETILKAKEQGKIRYIGFSAHTTVGALEAMKGFKFDTVMFPINFVEMFKRGFGEEVLDLASEQGAAVLAIKPMSKGPWPKDMEQTRRWWYRSTETQDETNAAMRYTLSLKQVVAGIPPSFLDLLDLAIEAGKTYQPITDAETQKLKETAEQCLTYFQKEEERVAHGGSLHDCCPSAYV